MCPNLPRRLPSLIGRAALSGVSLRYWNLFLKLMTEVIPVILLCLVTIVISADVVARTAFDRPVFAASEIGLISFVWLVWLGAAGVALRRDMMGINFFVEMLGPLRVPTMILSDVLILLICSYSAYATYQQISTARFTVFDALQWPKWILALGVFIGLLLLLVITALRVVRLFAGYENTPETSGMSDSL